MTASARPFLDRIFKPFARPTAPRRSAEERDARRTIDLCHALLTEGGEVLGRRLPEQVRSSIESLHGPAVQHFLSLLAEEFSVTPSSVATAIEEFRRDPSPTNLAALQAVVEPPRQELFRRINVAGGGTRVLVDLRRQLLRNLPAHRQLGVVDTDLVHLFKSWFNPGFLVLERINWHTSAVVLERLIQYEAVHQIQGWRELRRRLEADRRCYAFFHPAWPDEPLIFIEVALTRRMSTTIQPLLDPDAPVLDPATAQCAIFYSITQCQDGLRGISFGNFLIKDVVQDLCRVFPRVKTFATLSPIPGFRAWLESNAIHPRGGAEISGELAALIGKRAGDEPSSDKLATVRLRAELSALCAFYLLQAKHEKEPVDPVARFHLGNGARLERLNPMADTSPTGIRRSFGLMANYVYSIPSLETNHERYAKDFTIVASRQVERLAKQSPFLGNAGAGSAPGAH